MYGVTSLDDGRALVTRPKLPVLDEPTEGIQPSIIKEIGRAICYLRDSAGITILLVEQYLDFCRELADRVFIMDRGEIVHEGGSLRTRPGRCAQTLDGLISAMITTANNN